MDFLTHGTASRKDGTTLLLSGLTDEQMVQLEKILRIVHPDFQDSLISFHQERLRRYRAREP